MDDAAHLTVFGGSGIVPSFKGYMGQATVYRTQALKPDQVRRLFNFLAETHVYLWGNYALFRISGDVSSDFQSQLCCHLVEVYVLSVF